MVSYKKVGGLHFIKVARLTFMFCISKKKPAPLRTPKELGLVGIDARDLMGHPTRIHPATRKPPRAKVTKAFKKYAIMSAKREREAARNIIEHGRVMSQLLQIEREFERDMEVFAHSMRDNPRR